MMMYHNMPVVGVQMMVQREEGSSFDFDFDVAVGVELMVVQRLLPLPLYSNVFAVVLILVVIPVLAPDFVLLLLPPAYRSLSCQTLGLTCSSPVPSTMDSSSILRLSRYHSLVPVL